MLCAKHNFEPYEKDGDLYIKTWLIDDSRNRNGWRASWESIKQNAKSYIGRPGIEYTKCGEQGCIRDHTEADTLEKNLHKQERYRVSTIVDTVLDEANHTAYAIHKVVDKEFAEKIRRNEIQYLSPAIWTDKESTSMKNVDDKIHIDTTKWKATHTAFVDQPAYGQKAKVVSKCTGTEKCVNELKNSLGTNLTARAYITALYGRSVQFALMGGTKFKPRPGEKPWKDGKYYRNIMGTDIGFEVGQDISTAIEAVRKHHESQKNKPVFKPDPGEESDSGYYLRHINNKFYEFKEGEQIDLDESEMRDLEKHDTIRKQFQLGKTSVRIKGEIPPEKIAGMAKQWNSLPKEHRALVKTLELNEAHDDVVIEHLGTPAAGYYDHDEKLVNVQSLGDKKSDWATHVISHEVAHAVWRTYSDEQQKEWMTAVEKHGSPSTYAATYKARGVNMKRKAQNQARLDMLKKAMESGNITVADTSESVWEAMDRLENPDITEEDRKALEKHIAIEQGYFDKRGPEAVKEQLKIKIDSLEAMVDYDRHPEIFYNEAHSEVYSYMANPEPMQTRKQYFKMRNLTKLAKEHRRIFGNV